MTDYGTATSDAERLQAWREAIGRVLRAQKYGIRGERVERPDLKTLASREDELVDIANAPTSAASLGCITQVTSATDG